MDLFFTIVLKSFYYIFILQLIFVMFMGLKKADSGKRFAVIFQSFPFFLIYLSAKFIQDYKWNQYFIFIPIVLAILFFVLLRKRVFPYNRFCSNCGKQRNWKVIIFSDETVCHDCYGLKSENNIAAPAEENSGKDN